MSRSSELWATKYDKIGEQAASGELTQEQFIVEMQELGFESSEIDDHWDSIQEQL